MTASKIVAAAASGAGSKALDVNDVFSTFLYDGNGSARSINNGVDLAGEGGLVWFKQYNSSRDHGLFDTERGTGKYLVANDSAGEATTSTMLNAFNSDGFSFAGGGGIVNNGSGLYVSYSFRKAEKFFDVVKITGDGTSGRAINHALGSVPGMIIGKRYDTAGEHFHVYHRSLDSSSPQNYGIQLNRDLARADESSYWYDTAPTSTQFTVGNNLNHNGGSFIFYLFAHNNGDGTFGPDENQDIIKCGSYTGDSTHNQINLGFEPQWVIIKNRSSSGTDWGIFDTQRLWWNSSSSGDSYWFRSNNNNAESGIARFHPTATGFGFVSENGTHTNVSGDNYIYMAIRKGSLFPPENAADVFDVDARTGDSGNQGAFRSTFRVDFALDRTDRDTTGYTQSSSRLTGTKRLQTYTTNTESNQSAYEYKYQTGWYTDSGTDSNHFSWMWQRAPKFCDVVCWKGSGSARTLEHNLQKSPEMILVKGRNTSENWCVYHSALGNTKYLRLNSSTGEISDTAASRFNHTSPTSGNFSVGSDQEVNGSGYYYVAYLFTTLAGISKCGSFVADGNAQNIDCGFTNGSRFILIKKSSGPFNWRYWDSERGIVAGDDPYLHLNDTDAEATNGDWIDPLSSGFSITSAFSNGTYVFYAVAV